MSEQTKEIWAVINTGTKEYRETYKDKVYVIPAGKFIKLPRREALEFCGNCPGADAKTGKMIEKPLRIQRGPAPAGETLAQDYISPFTGEYFASEAELNAHIELYKDAHPETVAQADEPSNVSEPQAGEIVTPENNSGLLVCPICQLKVRGKHGLQIHLKACRE
jgi:hypothetical protein